MMFLAPFALAGCLALPAGSERITAADLAPAFAGLESVPPETSLSLAPAPGVDRIFRGPELRRIAAQFHLPAAPEEDICVARTVAQLDSAVLLAAMQKAMPDAKIAILEFTRQPAPQGEIIFQRSGLRANSGDGAVWYGAVRYAPHRDFTIWAKVMVTAEVLRVVAKRDIAPGQRIAPEDLEIETHEEFPSMQAILGSASEIEGKTSRVSIHAKTPIRLDMLENSQDVRSGDIVEVEVQEGAAHLTLEGRAEASGSVGDVIAVRNPASGKRFVAKVKGKGRVFVDSSAAKEKP